MLPVAHNARPTCTNRAGGSPRMTTLIGDPCSGMSRTGTRPPVRFAGEQFCSRLSTAARRLWRITQVRTFTRLPNIQPSSGSTNH